MSFLQLDKFGYEMKEYLGMLMGELLSYRIKIKGKSKDVYIKDPQSGGKVLAGNIMVLEKEKMQLLCQSIRDKDYLEIILAPKKPGKYVSDEYLDIVNHCLVAARNKLIQKRNMDEGELKPVEITKIDIGNPNALTCTKCKAPLPPVKQGTIVCPYCHTTN